MSSKIERLLNLTAVLLNTRRPLTSKEIRTAVSGYPSDDENFARMFERDKQDLRQMGVPLETKSSFVDETAEGYLISSDDYYLPDLDLTSDEKAALNLAVLSVQIDDVDARDVIWKLGGVDTQDSTVSAFGNIGIEGSLVELFELMGNSMVVKFDYKGETRLVSPWRLDFRRGRWYLIGHDHERGSVRNFRLDRFGEQVCAAKKVGYIPCDDADLVLDKKPWEYGDDMVDVTLRFDPEYVDYGRQSLGPRAVVASEHQSGTDFIVQASNVESLFSYVIDLLDHVEIVSPPEVRQRFMTAVSESSRTHG